MEYRNTLFLSIIVTIAITVFVSVFIYIIYTRPPPKPKKRKGRPPKKPTVKVVKTPRIIGDLNVCILGQGVNRYFKMKIPDEPTTFKYNNVEYEISKDALVIPKTIIFKRFLRWFLGEPPQYYIFFEEGEKQDKPIKSVWFQKTTILKTPEPTPEILSLTKRSQVLKKFFSKLFERHISSRQLMFILIMGGIAIILYLVMTKQIDINQLTRGRP